MVIFGLLLLLLRNILNLDGKEKTLCFVKFLLFSLTFQLKNFSDKRTCRLSEKFFRSNALLSSSFFIGWIRCRKCLEGATNWLNTEQEVGVWWGIFGSLDMLSIATLVGQYYLDRRCFFAVFPAMRAAVYPPSPKPGSSDDNWKEFMHVSMIAGIDEDFLWNLLQKSDSSKYFKRNFEYIAVDGFRKTAFNHIYPKLDMKQLQAPQVMFCCPFLLLVFSVWLDNI